MARLGITILLLLLATGAAAQSLTDCYNGVGLFTTATPDYGDWFDQARYLGGAASLTLYAVIFNPYNMNTGTPMDHLGGFEFQLVPERADGGPALTTGFTLLTGTNFMTPPNFYVGCNAPVVNGQVALVEVQVLVTEGAEANWYVRPVSQQSAQTIPGEITVTDADDGFSVSLATPVSYVFGVPVFCINTADCDGVVLGGGGPWGDCWPVDDEDASWGDVKALYR